MIEFELYNAVKMPAVGFGTFQIPDGEVCYNAVKKAIKCGYRHIDTASVYGNEQSVGRAIRESQVERKDIFVTSKVYNESRTYDLVLKAFDLSMKKIGLDYLDLYLIHWPANEVQYQDKAHYINSQTWKALETIYKEKRVRAIGLSNFMSHRIEILMEGAEFKPMVNQIEYHPGFTQEETTHYCQKNGIIVQGWSTLARGKALEEKTLIQIAQKYKKDVAQIISRWAIQNNVVPLVRSKTPQRIQSNIDVFDFELEKEDMKTINELKLSRIGVDPDLKEN